MTVPQAVLADGSGRFIGIEVLGYQYPEGSDDSADWLIIRLTADDGLERWSATDAALETGDLASFAAWLRAIATGSPYTDRLTFIEPCLVLEATGVGDEATITAILAYAFRPPRVPLFEEGRLPVRPGTAALQRCADAFEAARSAFPSREMP